MGEVSPRTCAGCLAQLLLKVLRSLRWETARISLSGQTQEDQNNTLSGHRVPYLSRELFGDKMNRGSHLRPEKSHVELLSVPWHLLGMRGVPSLETGLSPSSPSCPAPGELLPQHVLEMLFHPWPWLFPLLDPWPFPPENWSHFVITPSLIWLFLWRLHPHGLCSPLQPWLHNKHLWRKKGREGERVAGDGTGWGGGRGGGHIAEPPEFPHGWSGLTAPTELKIGTEHRINLAACFDYIQRQTASRCQPESKNFPRLENSANLLAAPAPFLMSLSSSIVCRA